MVGISPDIMSIAKGIGGGSLHGGVPRHHESREGHDGRHLTAPRFGGNPLAMAVGNAVLDVILEPGFDRGRMGLS